MPIDTPEQLRGHVARAIQIELTTIPPYLYAMYSIADQASDAAKLIRSVVVEEMLHVALTSNLLMSIGGEPDFCGMAAAVRYPGALPHHIPELIVHLETCSPELIRRVFLAIEQPEAHEAPLEPDQFESLGQFYHALEEAILRLSARHDLFADPRLDRQLSNPAAYVPVEYDSETSGGLVGIVDVDSAMRAIEIVIHQGEGLSEDRFADPEHRELTHYAKFLELADGTVPLGDVLPAVKDPSVATLPAPVRPVAELANALHSSTFVLLDHLYAHGTPDQPSVVKALYTTMTTLQRTVARYLMTLDAGNGTVAGPPFAFRPFEGPGSVADQLRQLARAVMPAHPALEPVAKTLEDLWDGRSRMS